MFEIMLYVFGLGVGLVLFFFLIVFILAKMPILGETGGEAQKKWDGPLPPIVERDMALKMEKERRKWEKFEQLQREKGLVKKIGQDGKVQWVKPTEEERSKDRERGLSNNFASYTPREFEIYIGDLFQKMGYEVQLTPAAGDYGVDVIAKKDGNIVAIQTKKYAEGNLVGAQDVQKTLGAMWKAKTDQSIIITTSGFTIQAREQAKGAPIELWDKKLLYEMIRKYKV